MTVKGNMPTLYRQLKKLPWAAVPAVSAVSTDHGRRARRTIKGGPGAGLDRVRRRGPGRAGTPHGHEEGEEDRRGRLPHHQRPRCRPGDPGRLGPRPLGDREQAPLGPRHPVPGRQIPGQNRKRAPASWHRCAAWPSACCAWTGIPTSPPPTATTPATRGARLSCFKPHERLCRVPAYPPSSKALYA